MSELKISLKDSTSMSEKSDHTSFSKEYILFLVNKTLSKEDCLFISSFSQNKNKLIVATDNEKNLSIKIDNCYLFYLDLKNKEKIQRLISMIKPIKIIEKWIKT